METPDLPPTMPGVPRLPPAGIRSGELRQMSSKLFSPIEIGGMQFHNRIAVSPMCQYSADDGSATDWHLQHWMMLAMSGAAMITAEATGVTRAGRITHSCLGIYSDN